ncbi:MAG: class I SAM-dependent methyltransferase [Proteobacteria bacterium]|nr:class I SAM-dependent methyltransferase [Pseudomonadota bacterium]
MSLRRGASAVAVLALAACASGTPGAAPGAISTQRIAEIVASPDRSAADRTNDQRRKPEQMLAFIGIRPGITALDVSAGGGYTTELLARAIGPTGTVYGQRPPPRDPSRPATPPAQPEGESRPGIAAAAPARNPAGPVAERDAKLRAAGVAAAPMIPVSQPFESPVPAAVADARLDLVTLMFNYHDMGHLGVDRAQMDRAIYRALKPGGVFVIADHAGRPGTGISESGTLHRIEESFLRREVEAAGFRLAEEGMFLRNPNDPRDRNTPDPPQPKDEFVLKFVKP